MLEKRGSMSKSSWIVFNFDVLIYGKQCNLFHFFIEILRICNLMLEILYLKEASIISGSLKHS